MNANQDLANKSQRLLKILRSLGIIFSLVAILTAASLSTYVVITSLTTSFFYQNFSKLASAIFLLAYPPLVIFIGFYNQDKIIDETIGRALETFVIILALAFSIINLHLLLGTAAEWQLILLYIIPVILGIVGLSYLYTIVVAQKKDRQVEQAYFVLILGLLAAITIAFVLLIINFGDTGSVLSLTWSLILLAAFPLPLAVIIIRRIRSGPANLRATFRIWSGLGGMLVAMLIGMFSIGLFYLPIYLSIMITAFISEFI